MPPSTRDKAAGLLGLAVAERFTPSPLALGVGIGKQRLQQVGCVGELALSSGQIVNLVSILGHDGKTTGAAMLLRHF